MASHVSREQINNCKVPRPCGFKTSHYTSATVLDSWHEVFGVICCILFSPEVSLGIIATQFHFGFIYPKHNVPKLLRFVQMEPCFVRLPCSFHTEELFADFFPSWHFVKTYLNTQDQQITKVSNFLEMVTLAEDHTM